MPLLYSDKIPHPANFTFAPAAQNLRASDLGGDVFRIQAARRPGKPARANPSLAVLAEKIPGETTCRVVFEDDGSIRVADKKGRALLEGVPAATFGRSGDAWMLQFRHNRRMCFYGLGEHSRGFEKTGQRVKFWNTDLLGDYYFDQVRRDHANPMYVSIPWLVIRQGGVCAGIFAHHPGCVFMDTASGGTGSRSFYVGAPDGQPDVYLLVGPGLAELTQKFQRLVGFTPLPPLWSLGYHQSRWGYAGPRDLDRIDKKLRASKIPCDALWLDIDYMERHKVFTFAKKHWGGERNAARALSALRRRGRRVVAIIDPGVKVEPGYDVCEEGLKRDLFCHNRAGKPYVGIAWPGPVFFPDFSLPETRDWWARRVGRLARAGIAAAWIDMNDPSTGPVEPGDMLFDRGRKPHAACHNQYALGMAEATRAGFLAANPALRPFLLSRSACATSGRFTAVWTGDNFSNWHHLRTSIPTLLNLALSGIPFAGADVGGFADNATRDLVVAWHKAAFLLPFFRNHNSAGVRGQEPWTFGRTACGIIARYVRLRYKFLPYLYQLFVRQAACGEAILRPLIHDFASTRALPLDRVADQFLIGPSLMHAPVVEENASSRSVILPGKTRWFSLAENRWLEGGRKIRARAGAHTTPLYVRDGSLIPMRAGDHAGNRTDLREIELHVFLAPGSRARAACAYAADDGETHAWQKGARTTAAFRATLSREDTLTLRAITLADGCGPLRIRIFAGKRIRRIRMITSTSESTHALRPAKWRAAGKLLDAAATGWIELQSPDAKP